MAVVSVGPGAVGFVAVADETISNLYLVTVEISKHLANKRQEPLFLYSIPTLELQIT